MNVVTAWGGNKKRRELAERVVNFCIVELMPRMRTLDICVEITNDCPNCGYCLAVNPREFVIEVKNCKDDLEFIETICHEMVHVKQGARKELLDISLTLKKWKGEEWITIFSDIEDYFNFPWEKEAYALESVLTKKFLGIE
jgi:hypothetical protein